MLMVLNTTTGQHRNMCFCVGTGVGSIWNTAAGRDRNKNKNKLDDAYEDLMSLIGEREKRKTKHSTERMQLGTKTTYY